MTINYVAATHVLTKVDPFSSNPHPVFLFYANNKQHSSGVMDEERKYLIGIGRRVSTASRR